MSGDRRRWVWGALVVSALLNLFLGGLAIGHWVGPHVAAKPAQGGALVARGKLRALPVGERVAFGLAMRAHQPVVRAARLKLKSARRDAAAAIAAPTYDPPQVAQRLAAVRAAAAEQQTAVHGALVEALAKLSPASRASLVAPSGAVGDGSAAR